MDKSLCIILDMGADYLKLPADEYALADCADRLQNSHGVLFTLLAVPSNVQYHQVCKGGVDELNLLAERLATMDHWQQDAFIGLAAMQVRDSNSPLEVPELINLTMNVDNPGFKPVEFDGFKNASGANSFTMSPKKWIEGVNAIGIVSRAGRYGGTFAHRDIAFEFASWVSAEFKLYIIKDYQRLKSDENSRLTLGWNLNRTLAKINYRIHTDAIKDMLIPPDVTPQRQGITYANEADVLNVALFGITAKEWRQANPNAKGNIRDEASLQQLIVLANMESINAELIRQKVTQRERLLRLNASAKQMMQSLIGDKRIKELSE